MIINLFGGTFDPPTLGHLSVANEIINLAGNVTWLPGGATPHKNPIATPEQRYEMISLMIQGLPNHSILGLELNKNKNWKSIHTAMYLNKQGFSINWWLGTDSYNSVNTWEQSELLKKLVNFRVLPRSNNDISSTSVRSDVLNSKDMLNQEVYRYLIDNKLYL